MWPFNKKNRVRICSTYTPRVLAAKQTVDGRWYVDHPWLDMVFLDNWGEDKRVSTIDAMDWTEEEIKQRISKVSPLLNVPKDSP